MPNNQIAVESREEMARAVSNTINNAQINGAYSLFLKGEPGMGLAWQINEAFGGPSKVFSIDMQTCNEPEKTLLDAIKSAKAESKALILENIDDGKTPISDIAAILTVEARQGMRIAATAGNKDIVNQYLGCCQACFFVDMKQLAKVSQAVNKNR